jgi:hypothetical protein
VLSDDFGNVVKISSSHVLRSGSFGIIAKNISAKHTQVQFNSQDSGCGTSHPCADLGAVRRPRFNLVACDTSMKIPEEFSGPIVRWVGASAVPNRPRPPACGATTVTTRCANDDHDGPPPTTGTTTTTIAPTTTTSGPTTHHHGGADHDDHAPDDHHDRRANDDDHPAHDNDDRSLTTTTTLPPPTTTTTVSDHDDDGEQYHHDYAVSSAALPARRIAVPVTSGSRAL